MTSNLSVCYSLSCFNDQFLYALWQSGQLKVEIAGFVGAYWSICVIVNTSYRPTSRRTNMELFRCRRRPLTNSNLACLGDRVRATWVYRCQCRFCTAWCGKRASSSTQNFILIAVAYNVWRKIEESTLGWMQFVLQQLNSIHARPFSGEHGSNQLPYINYIFLHVFRNTIWGMIDAGFLQIQARCRPYLSPKQQCQSTENNSNHMKWKIGCYGNVPWRKITKFLAVVIFHRRCWRNNPCCDPSTRCRLTGSTFKQESNISKT